MIHPLLCNARPNFYPRSPCGERHGYEQYYIRARAISIHALLAESDARRALGFVDPDISIHALLAESDRTPTTVVTLICISIHALLAESDRLFGSSGIDFSISIHALLAESDSQQPQGTTRTTYFYPRSPCGERLPAFWSLDSNAGISIHALLAESDIYGCWTALNRL